MNIDDLRKLAGVGEKSNPINNENISITGDEKAKLMKKHNIKPGTDDWFKLWFSKPYLTGEKPVKDK